jgi:hypothetical protein
MVEMGRKFAERSLVHVGFCADSVARLLEGLIADGICLVSDGGMIGGLVFAHPFNNAHLAAQELFWWSEGREGLLLLSAFESACMERGAASITMITLDAVEPEKTGRIYQRRGYVPLERSFVKVL